MSIVANLSMRVKQTHVFLADDQPQVRSALRILLDQEAAFIIVGEAANANDMVALSRVTRPDLILLDWELPGLSPLDSISALRSTFPDVKIIVLSSRMEARYEALAAGADTFISKVDPPDRLLAALRLINLQINGDRDRFGANAGQQEHGNLS